MKKYLIFLAIFIGLYLAMQIAMGGILTILYKPEVTSAKNDAVFKLASYVPTVSIILSALIAYFLSEKLNKLAKARAN
ncbi:hypothetical protein [Sporosarcina sp. NPDC096371]|uniref:hypothetical protein n=1 Tax=Sporosarcina sp. NPDC096371 TaxID=3364530 RepID=UPI00382DE801